MAEHHLLTLPGEIRNLIFGLLLPSPAQPELLFLDKYDQKCEDGGTKYDERETNVAAFAQFSKHKKRGNVPSLHLVCRQMHSELPTMDCLLRTGAIVPAMPIVRSRCNQFAEEVEAKILRNASCLRLTAFLDAAYKKSKTKTSHCFPQDYLSLATDDWEMKSGLFVRSHPVAEWLSHHSYDYECGPALAVFLGNLAAPRPTLVRVQMVRMDARFVQFLLRGPVSGIHGLGKIEFLGDEAVPELEGTELANSCLRMMQRKFSPTQAFADVGLDVVRPKVIPVLRAAGRRYVGVKQINAYLARAGRGTNV